jgi:dihydrofolate reductase
VVVNGWEHVTCEASDCPGTLVCKTLDAALVAAEEISPAGTVIWIGGGSDIYAEAFPLADELVVVSPNLSYAFLCQDPFLVQDCGRLCQRFQF